MAAAQLGVVAVVAAAVITAVTRTSQRRYAERSMNGDLEGGQAAGRQIASAGGLGALWSWGGLHSGRGWVSYDDGHGSRTGGGGSFDGGGFGGMDGGGFGGMDGGVGAGDGGGAC